VSPTVPFDIVLSFIFGAVIALAGSARVREVKSAFLNPYFLAAILFEVCFFLPFGVYLYYFYPDWSWMYFFDPGKLELRTLKLLGFLAMAGYLGSLILGFQVAQFLIRQGRGKVAWGMVLTALVALGLFGLLTINRLMFIGSYSDYRTGLATLLLKHHVGYLNTLVGVIMAGALFFMIRTFRASPERH